MLLCDLHVHTVKSRCGYATPLEMMNHAANIGLHAMAITDHGLHSGGYISHALFRLPAEYRNVRIYKGIEITVHDDLSKTGIPMKYLPLFDIILAGFHHKLTDNPSPEYHARTLLNYLKAHPYIDAISHPCIQTYPINMEIFIPEAVALGVAFEINNKNLLLQATDLARLRRMIELVVEHRGLFMFNSDAHITFELGDDSGIRALLESTPHIPSELIVNQSLQTTSEFIQKRRLNKQRR